MPLSAQAGVRLAYIAEQVDASCLFKVCGTGTECSNHYRPRRQMKQTARSLNSSFNRIMKED